MTTLANIVILKAPRGLPFMRMFFIISIAYRTTITLVQKRDTEFGCGVSFLSAFFALCCGLAMKSRSTFMKNVSPVASSSGEKSTYSSRQWK